MVGLAHGSCAIDHAVDQVAALKKPAM